MSKTYWFTGLSGAGKTTLVTGLARRLKADARAVLVLDGDLLRADLSSDLGFGPEDRLEQTRRAASISKLANQQGIWVLVALISPMRSGRAQAKEIVGGDAFEEVFVQCPLEVCEQRDAKGLYRRARAGEIEMFTGVSSPYERPLLPNYVIDTSELTIEEAQELMWGYLEVELNRHSAGDKS